MRGDLSHDSRRPKDGPTLGKKTRRGNGGLVFAADLERLLCSRGGRAVISTVDFITHPLSFLPRRRRNRTFIISRQEWERHDLSRCTKKTAAHLRKKRSVRTSYHTTPEQRHTHPKMCRGGAREEKGPSLPLHRQEKESQVERDRPTIGSEPSRIAEPRSFSLPPSALNNKSKARGVAGCRSWSSKFGFFVFWKNHVRAPATAILLRK